MGHLIEIAKEIFRLAQTHSFSALMTETVDNETLNKWENFVNTTLYEIQETYMVSIRFWKCKLQFNRSPPYLFFYNTF